MQNTFSFKPHWVSATLLLYETAKQGKSRPTYVTGSDYSDLWLISQVSSDLYFNKNIHDNSNINFHFFPIVWQSKTAMISHRRVRHYFFPKEWFSSKKKITRWAWKFQRNVTFSSTIFLEESIRMLWKITFKIQSTLKHVIKGKPEIFQNILFDIKIQSVWIF